MLQRRKKRKTRSQRGSTCWSPATLTWTETGWSVTLMTTLIQILILTTTLIQILLTASLVAASLMMSVRRVRSQIQNQPQSQGQMSHSKRMNGADLCILHRKRKRRRTTRSQTMRSLTSQGKVRRMNIGIMNRRVPPNCARGQCLYSGSTIYKDCGCLLQHFTVPRNHLISCTLAAQDNFVPHSVGM